MDSLWGLSIFYLHHVRGKTKRKGFSFWERLRGHKSFVDPVVFRPET